MNPFIPAIRSNTSVYDFLKLMKQFKIPEIEQARSVFMATICGIMLLAMLTWFLVNDMLMKILPMKINMIPRTVNGKVSAL